MIEINYWAAAVAIKRPSKSESFGSFLNAKVGCRQPGVAKCPNWDRAKLLGHGARPDKNAGTRRQRWDTRGEKHNNTMELPVVPPRAKSLNSCEVGASARAANLPKPAGPSNPKFGPPWPLASAATHNTNDPWY